jgi:hypothetical protein
MTISVTENTDGTFTIDWDENDPKESLFNDWTEEDFANAISSYLEELIGQSDDPDNEEFAIEDALEDILNQRQEVVIEGDKGSENASQIVIEGDKGSEISSQIIRKDEEDERLPRLFF